MQTGKYAHVLSFALDHPWAITRPMLSLIADILARRIAGTETEPAELSALVTRKNLPQPAKGGVAIIPIWGVIAPRLNMMSDFSGGTTFEGLTDQLLQAVANPDVKTIVFDIDSPGGNVAGATEFAREVLKARTTKPIIAQAHHSMGSAAYWVGACATEVVASPSAQVGAIGVYTIHEDISESLAKLGVKIDVIAAGKFKGEGRDGGPLGDDARAHLQGRIDGAYKRFIGDVAKGRGVKDAAVRSGFGEGRAVSADEALDLGMIDKIATLSDTLARVATSAPRGTTSRADDATAQELPTAATAQERAADLAWERGIDAALQQL